MRGVNRTGGSADGAAMRVPPSDLMPSQMAYDEQISLSCYENEVPFFVAAELDRLYGHINSSLSHYVLRRRAEGSSTYVARKKDRVTAILLFKIEGGRVLVLNELIRIEQPELLRFTRYIFSTFPSVSVVSFSYIQKEMRRLPFPSQEYNSSEDIVLSLPDTPEEYHARLGKNMRRNLKRYNDTLKRDFPSYRYQVYETSDIREQDVRDIVNLNRTRITDKNIVFGIPDEEIDWLVELVKKCGLIGVATVEERICGGAVGFRIGDNYFMHIIGHDPAFNDYSLGILCYYHTICQGILRGGKEFHFSYGRYEYKYRLLGVQRDMACLDIYRSRTAYMQNAPTVVRNAARTAVQRSRMKLLDMERQSTPIARSVTQMLRVMRKLKRLKRS